MNYTHPFFSQDDITIPIPNPGQHPSAPLQILRRESYSTLNGAMTGSMMALSNQPPGPVMSSNEEMEEMDTSSRPRLTQEQIATLEDHFQGKPKPGTDFKKNLASQIGLSLRRVNVSVGVGDDAVGGAKRCDRIGTRTVGRKLGIKSRRNDSLTCCRSIRALRGP